MRKALSILVVGILTFTAMTTAQAQLKHHSKEWKTCRVNQAGPRYNHKDVKRTIRCGVDHWRVRGGVRKALCVARKESGFGARASNGGRYLGVYQHAREYWPGRQNGYDRRRPRLRDIRESAFNGRSNVLVSIRMAHKHGWGPWSTADSC